MGIKYPADTTLLPFFQDIAFQHTLYLALTFIVIIVALKARKWSLEAAVAKAHLPTPAPQSWWTDIRRSFAHALQATSATLMFCPLQPLQTQIPIFSLHFLARCELNPLKRRATHKGQFFVTTAILPTRLGAGSLLA